MMNEVRSEVRAWLVIGQVSGRPDAFADHESRGNAVVSLPYI